MYILVMIDVLLFDVMMQVNQILSAIKRKKSMDAIILSLVASVCTFLIFIYWLTK
jgi:ABC-type sulfate transport system permease component